MAQLTAALKEANVEVNDVFETLVWENGQMRMGDLVFEVEDRARAHQGHAAEAFVLGREIVRQ